MGPTTAQRDMKSSSSAWAGAASRSVRGTEAAAADTDASGMDGLRTTFFLIEIDWSTFRESPRNEGFLPSGFGSAAKTGMCPPRPSCLTGRRAPLTT